MKTNTKPAPTRCLWQQGFRDALQRLSVTLMLVMLTASAWAQVIPQTKYYYLYLDPNYQGGGGIGRIDVPVSDPTTTYTLTSYDEPIRTGYMFCGWSTSSTGAVQYRTNDQITLTGNLMLYAKWIKNDCTVTFYANGGIGAMPAATGAVGTEFVIPSCGFSYDGYFCAGWATSVVGEIVYHPGDKITLTDDLTLYAKWLDVTISGTCGHVSISTGLTGSEVTWRLTHSEGSAGYDLLTISSINNGWIADYEDGESPWYAYREQIKTIVIGDGVVHIGRRAFKDCTGVNSVSFGNSVNTIYYDAFSNCTSLTSVILPPSMREIYDNAFRNTGLTSVTLNDGLQTIGDCAFYECAGLTSVSIPASVTNIGDYAFHKTSLTSVSIPASVRVIGSSAFQGCSSLQSVTIFAPELDWYSAYAFDNNASGRKIYVFSDCVETYKSEWSKYANAIEAIPALAVRDAGGELGSWCTYYNGMADVTVADGTTVYTAKRNNEGGVTLTATGSNIIKRGEAVLLKSAANVVLSSAASSGDGVYDGNELQGVDVETPQDANTTYYVLSKVNGVFGFYKLARENGNSEPIKLGANKAYLAVANAHDAPEFIGFGENTTAINEHEFNESHELSGAIYDLQGRKIANGQKPTAKGLYIVNGKKIVIK